MTLTLLPRPAALPPPSARAARPVRVCFLIDDLAAAGTEMQLLALLRHLDRTRVQPYLCLLRGDSPMSRTLEPDDCPVLRLRVKSLLRPSTLMRTWRFRRYLREQRIDVVQAFFPDSCYFGLPAAWLAGVPHRLRTRNNLGHWLTPLHRLLGRLLNLVTTRTVTNCPAARAALLAAEGPRPESVVVLENGVDLDSFAVVAPLDDEPVGVVRVGAVANLRPVKGLDLLVEAAARLAPAYPRVVFEVAGQGDMRGELGRQVRERGLAGRFRFRGIVTDIPGFLDSLRIAVLCSHAEGMSNALLEYMAAGRAVVATAVGATPDLIADGVHGLLVPPGNVGALTAAIDRLLRNPEFAARLGRAAAARVHRHYSRGAMVRRFENFYQSLAARGQRNAADS
jgi:glycosyltransferase involved in cell wall biosynthesis